MARNSNAARRLLKILGRSEKLLVLMHENPDPDAIASGAALSYIASTKLRLDATLAYTGIVGRAENKAMVELLGIEMVELEQGLLVPGQAIAVVDAQPDAGNLLLPSEEIPSIVIDHHPLSTSPTEDLFTDIRPDYGATSTILAEYLLALGLPIPIWLATALFYGIKTDTQDLGRYTNEADRKAYAYLWNHVDKQVLPRIEYPRLPREYFETLRTAMERAFVYGDVIISSLDEMDSPNDVAEVADLLLRLEGIEWSLCTGFFGAYLYVSLRTSDPDVNAGGVVRRVMRGLGSSGGHGMMAAGKAYVPRGALEARLKAQDDNSHLAGIRDEIRDRFLRLVGAHPKAKEKLLALKPRRSRPSPVKQPQRHEVTKEMEA